MDFKWDARKAKANFEKHKVTFEEASSVFYDPHAKLGNDPDHSDYEDRFILIGHSQKNNLLFVVHVYRESESTIRIVSARKATRTEKRDFEEL
jgi:uncharacterized DUF497 family protein